MIKKSYPITNNMIQIYDNSLERINVLENNIKKAQEEIDKIRSHISWLVSTINF